MYTIIVRQGGYNHDYKANSATDAYTLFHVLIKTFIHVEMWLGADLVQKYNNA